MPTLSEYANVYESAIEVLRKKGFQVWHDRNADMYGAERDGWDFLADTPIGLLGLVAIYEAVQPESYAEYWWKAAGTAGALPEAPEPYVSVLTRRRT